MFRQPLFIFLFFLLFLMAVLHITATMLFFYWIYPWFDNMMHFLGGLLVGLTGLWLVFQSGYLPSGWMRYSPTLIVGVGIVIVGVGWEVFEYLTGISLQQSFVADTISDLLMDGLGAIVGYLSFIHLYGHSYEH
jgi:hypothetical protein